MKNQKELQIIFGFVIDASAQLNRVKEGRFTASGTLILTTNVNQNAIGVKSRASARSTKFFNKKFTNIKEKNYETQ